MKNKIILILNIVFLFHFLSANENVQQRMLQDLDVLKYNMLMKYAPLAYKKQACGWDFEVIFNQVRAKILNGEIRTTKEYQIQIKQLLSETRDYHVVPNFYSTEVSFYPIGVKCVEGKYYVVSFPRPHLSEVRSGFTFEPFSKNEKKIYYGDEIIAIDGVPIRNVIEDLIQKELGNDQSATAHTFAENMLFLRQGKYGHEIPKGLFTLTIKNYKVKTPYQVTLEWMHIPEFVADPIITSSHPYRLQMSCEFDSIRSNEIQNHEFLNLDYSVQMAKDFSPQTKDHLLQQYFGSEVSEKKKDEREKGFLPKLGEVLWETELDDDLYGYIYQNDVGNRIGYIYLPSFAYHGIEGNRKALQIAQVLHFFDQETEALIFDLTDNTGGNLLFMYAVLSLLSDTSLKTLPQSQILTQEEIYQAASFLHSNHLDSILSGYETDEECNQNIKEYSKNLLENWKAGYTFSHRAPILGIENIKPNSLVQYTKPLIVLINESSFSCGEFFPAIIQDNKRGIVLGKKTAGAGGYVKTYFPISGLGIKSYSMTHSMIFRLDGQPLENNGITPDIAVEITLRDLQKKFVDYKGRLNLEIRKLLRKN